MYKAQQRLAMLFTLLISSVFILAPFYSQHSPGGEGLNIPYNSVVWLAAIVCICAASFQILLKTTLVLPRYWLAMAALPIGLLISGFIVETILPTQWLFRIGYVLGGFLFFIALFQFQLKRRHLENILYSLCLAATIHSLIAFTQTMGWHFTSLIPRTASNAPISIFQQVNVHASYLVTGFLLALYLATCPSIKSRHWVFKLILIATVLCTITMLLNISSRASLVAFAVATPLLIIARYQAFCAQRRFSAVLIAAFTFGVLAGSIQFDGVAKYETKVDSQRVHARTYIYDLSWQIFQQNPVFGHGLGSFKQVFQEAKIDYPHSDKLGPAPYTHPHNELFFWLIESGIISLLGIIIALVATVVAMLKLGWRRGLSYFALLFPISFHSQVELPFYHSSALWFLWVFFLFMVHKHRVRATPVLLSAAADKLLKGCTAISCIGLITFFLHSLISLSGLVHFIYGGKTDYNYLRVASNNLYYQDLAYNVSLTRGLYIDIALGEQKRSVNYIDWAEAELVKHPTPSTINNLALAYVYTQQPKLALTLMEKAVKMYPVTKEIIQRHQEVQQGLKIADFKKNIQSAAGRNQGQARP